MMDNNGAVTNSIPSRCDLYDPIEDKPIDVKCSKLGMLYECKNCTKSEMGCLFCGHFIPESKEKL